MFGKLTVPQLALLRVAVTAQIEKTENVFRAGIPAGSEASVVTNAVLQAANDFAELNKMRDAIDSVKTPATRKKPGRKPKNAVPAVEVVAPVQADAK